MLHLDRIANSNIIYINFIIIIFSEIIHVILHMSEAGLVTIASSSRLRIPDSQQIDERWPRPANNASHEKVASATFFGTCLLFFYRYK
jgi:hypothetical protein